MAPKPQARTAPAAGGAIAVMGEFDPPAPGTSHGEFVIGSPPETQRSVLRELVDAPPEWADRVGDAHLEQVADPPPSPPRNAIAEMLADDPDREWPEVPLGDAPPLEPLPEFAKFVPPVDWELEAKEEAQREREARERQARELREQVLKELLAEEQPARYPPPRRPS